MPIRQDRQLPTWKRPRLPEQAPVHFNRPPPSPLSSLDPTLLRSAFSLLFLSAHVLPHPSSPCWEHPNSSPGAPPRHVFV